MNPKISDFYNFYLVNFFSKGYNSFLGVLFTYSIGITWKISLVRTLWYGFHGQKVHPGKSYNHLKKKLLALFNFCSLLHHRGCGFKSRPRQNISKEYFFQFFKFFWAYLRLYYPLLHLDNKKVLKVIKSKIKQKIRTWSQPGFEPWTLHSWGKRANHYTMHTSKYIYIEKSEVIQF